MTRRALSISAALGCALLAAGCGGDGGSTSTTTVASGDNSAAPAKHRSTTLTPAKERKLEAIVRRDVDFVRVVGDSRAEVAEVIPWVGDGGRDLIGAEITFDVTPPLELTNERVPGVISPNQEAPPETPSLHRYALVSASNVTQLHTEAELESERTVKIEPGGDRAKITKLQLIGPPPDDPAYRPEPGY